MQPTFFIKTLTDKVYKILPLKEEEEKGNEVYVLDYIDSLLVEVIGACSTFDSLDNNSDYITVLNTIQYLSQHDFTVKKCKREVFKMLNLLNRIEQDIGGDDIE